MTIYIPLDLKKGFSFFALQHYQGEGSPIAIFVLVSLRCNVLSAIVTPIETGLF